MKIDKLVVPIFIIILVLKYSNLSAQKFSGWKKC